MLPKLSVLLGTVSRANSVSNRYVVRHVRQVRAMSITRRAFRVVPFPSRRAVWVDLFRATCEAVAPQARRWTLALQFVVVAGAVTLS